MLENLLQFVARGGIHSYEELAEHLSISLPFLEAMLEDLARLGYLRLAGDGCSTHCGSCPMGGCSVSGPSRLWAVTERGMKAAARHESHIG